MRPRATAVGSDCTEHRSMGLTVIADVVETLLKSQQGVGDMYAGIEIGAKGVKLSVIEVKLSKDREYDYTLISDTSINTDAAALSTRWCGPVGAPAASGERGVP